MTTPREDFMAAAQASLAAMFPARQVLRGYRDPAVLGDDALRQGVICLIAEGTQGWTEYTGREGQFGTLAFTAVYWCALPVDADQADTEALEQLEAACEGELLAWCQAIKPGPLDAVYPKRATYSGGAECPYGWVVLRMEGGYV